MNKHRGYTLIEILIAIVILSVMSVMAYGGMDYVFKSNEIVEVEGESLESYQMAFRVIRNDLELAIERSVRDRLGTDEKAFIGPPESKGKAIKFTTNIGSPMQLNTKNSGLQRIEYELRDSQLLRHSWQVLDRAHDSEPRTIVLIKEVNDLTFSFVSTAEHEFWPLPSSDEEFLILPRAVRMNITMNNQLQLERLFLVRTL